MLIFKLILNFPFKASSLTTFSVKLYLVNLFGGEIENVKKLINKLVIGGLIVLALIIVWGQASTHLKKPAATEKIIIWRFHERLIRRKGEGCSKHFHQPDLVAQQF